jgi:hypothetical protein
MLSDDTAVVEFAREGTGNGRPLAKALEALRYELALAYQDTQGQRARFHASEVKLTTETVIRSDKEAPASIRWYVLHAGGGVTSGWEVTQTIELTLPPGLYDENGNRSSLDVAADQSSPGQ